MEATWATRGGYTTAGNTSTDATREGDKAHIHVMHYAINKARMSYNSPYDDILCILSKSM